MSDAPAPTSPAAAPAAPAAPAAAAAPGPSSPNASIAAAPAPPKKDAGHEFEPPLHAVKKLLKQALPSHSIVGKDASAAFSRAAGIFILYLTSAANDFAHDNKRQTISAADVLAAVKEVEFGMFSDKMEAFLEQYRAEEEQSKERKKAEKAQQQAKGEGAEQQAPAQGEAPPAAMEVEEATPAETQ
ncbi:hypothetical protein TeGR_g6463 [Tetraparma gracilis]|uniref:Transcription factor CBF/NF-Y/archaeal histone domain-containing protein n=1 Tax=Tetraparma gracilis TaxID=2962635 RepID=A0ABQ6MH91_9STRA|nr:hypothetical protein TeGR_g6463 [Tetraparma gracilis]